MGKTEQHMAPAPPLCLLPPAYTQHYPLSLSSRASGHPCFRMAHAAADSVT